MYKRQPLNTEELKGTMEKVREKCSRYFWEKKSQAVVTAENFRNLLGFSAGEKEVLWEDICRSLSLIHISYLQFPTSKDTVPLHSQENS